MAGSTISRLPTLPIKRSSDAQRTFLASLFACLVYGVMLPARAQDKPLPDEALAQDLKLLQGKWELVHGNDGKGGPSTRSIKEIKGNQETLRRYDVKTGKLTREHTVGFKLSASGNVRVFTFYAVGKDPKRGQSFVYKVDAENFYDIPGLLHGEPYRNYQETPVVWHWKRVKGESSPEVPSPGTAEKPPAKAPLSPPEVPADVQASLQAIDAKLSNCRSRRAGPLGGGGVGWPGLFI